MNQIRRPCIVAKLALAALLPCCSLEPPAPAAPAPTAKKAAAPATTAQSNAPKAAFSYSPVGKRDPFRSYLFDIERREIDVQRSRPREVTEKYELEQYHFMGVVTDTTHPKAMVEDPSGSGHVVRLGSRLGKNGGRVARIDAKQLVVVEDAVDATGKSVRVHVVKHLPHVAVEQASDE